MQILVNSDGYGWTLYPSGDEIRWYLDNTGPFGRVVVCRYRHGENVSEITHVFIIKRLK